jgi:hypothetical protein
MTDDVRRLADAVLYEGHVLWPYRRSAVKNRQRWTFGGVYPAAYARSSSDRATVGVDCLVEGDEPAVDVEVRFLQAVHRQAMCGTAPVDEVGGFLTWDEATERTVWARCGAGLESAVAVRFEAGSAQERVEGGSLLRTWERLEGHVRVSVEPHSLHAGLWLVSLSVANESAWPGTQRDEAVRRTLLSAHALLHVEGGAFVSGIDPPAELADATAELRRDGLWPVLVGEEGERTWMLASPIILEDYARVAPESPGDFFDGGEIDQLLVLNILGLTDAEKEELRAGDPRARAVLERTEAMSDEDVLRLSGTIRDLRPSGAT